MTQPLFTQNIDNFFADNTHDSLLLPKEYDVICQKLQPYHAQIVTGSASPNQAPVFTAYDDTAMHAWRQVADYYKEAFDDVVLLGMGGSSLGARVLQEIAWQKTQTKYIPNLHIVTNTDPATYYRLWQKLDVKRTGLIVISKSGKTIETLMQLMIMLPTLKQKLSLKELEKRICVITELKQSPLHDMATHYKWRILPHEPNLSGRYSVLSVVGLLPALIMGLDITKIQQGAQQILQEYRAQDYTKVASVQSAACLYGLMHYKHMRAVVMLAYADRFASLSQWFRQLWAESLGKKGFGSVPIDAVGPVDQHSQLQLWLDGPRDKIFTLLSVSYKPANFNIDPIDAHLSTQSVVLQNSNLEALMHASANATQCVLQEQQLPIRTLHLPEFDEATIGALLMHFMLETMHCAYLYNINPFDQPAVEKGKKIIWQNIAAKT